MKGLDTYSRAAAWLAVLMCPLLRADVTMTYKTEVKLNPSLPQELASQALKGMGGALGTDSTTRLKGSKGFSSSGSMTSIVDFEKKEITLIDPAGKRYATLPAAGWAGEFAKAMPGMPPAAQAAMASIKTSFDSKATGRTAGILGVEAEEREVSLTIDGPEMSGRPPGPLMRIAIHFWTSKPGEAIRVPAIREATGYALWSFATLNPAASLEKMFQQMPGFGEGLGKMIEEFQSGRAVILRMHMDVFMPGMLAMLEKLPPDKNPFGAGFDASLPFLQVNQELAELSTAPVPDSVFRIPAGFTSAPIAELIQTLITNQQVKQP
jgi:hypothetical protein